MRMTYEEVKELILQHEAMGSDGDTLETPAYLYKLLEQLKPPKPGGAV